MPVIVSVCHLSNRTERRAVELFSFVYFNSPESLSPTMVSSGPGLAFQRLSAAT